MKTITKSELLKNVGGLSEPSKMPCHGWSTSARNCHVGSKLRKVSGSVCSICYALKGRYVFPQVQKALDRRMEVMMAHRRFWAVNMIETIRKVEKSGYFRWFDSGDLRDLHHLEDIAFIARSLPKIRFWLPTKEYGIVGQYALKNGKPPKNLTIRLSGYMLNGPPPTEIAHRLGVLTSGVSKDSFNCPSSKQGNKCGECRACWDSKKNINYKQH